MHVTFIGGPFHLQQRHVEDDWTYVEFPIMSPQPVGLGRIDRVTMPTFDSIRYYLSEFRDNWTRTIVQSIWVGVQQGHKPDRRDHYDLQDRLVWAPWTILYKAHMIDDFNEWWDQQVLIHFNRLPDRPGRTNTRTVKVKKPDWWED